MKDSIEKLDALIETSPAEDATRKCLTCMLDEVYYKMGADFRSRLSSVLWDHIVGVGRRHEKFALENQSAKQEGRKRDCHECEHRSTKPYLVKECGECIWSGPADMKDNFKPKPRK